MQNQTMILDLGSHDVKYGYDDGDSPKLIPNIYGIPKLNKSFIDGAAYKPYVESSRKYGLDTIKWSHNLSWKYPIGDGEIIEMEHIEKILEPIFKEKQQRLVFTESKK
jgi:actin-related protein